MLRGRRHPGKLTPVETSTSGSHATFMNSGVFLGSRICRDFGACGDEAGVGDPGSDVQTIFSYPRNAADGIIRKEFPGAFGFLPRSITQ